jgi:hypothetical protein
MMAVFPPNCKVEMWKEFASKEIGIYLVLKKKKNTEPGTVVSRPNPSYSGGRDQEDRSSKPAEAKSLSDPILKNPSQKGSAEWLKVKALSLSPSTIKKKKKSRHWDIALGVKRLPSLC